MMLIVALGVSLLSGLSGVPAEAASHGHHLNINGFIAGNYLSSDGRSYVYCIEPGADEPYGAQNGPRKMATLPAYEGDLGNSSTAWNGTVWDSPVSGQTLREMNYVMWTHGRTTNAEQAATVQFAVWLLRRGPGTSAWLDHHINWVRAHGHGWLIDDAERMVVEAREQATPAQAASPEPLHFVGVDYASGDDGAAVARGSVAYPAHTEQLSISGGIFRGAGAQLPVSGNAAGDAEWEATLHPDGWQRLNTVRIDAEWKREVVAWPDEVMVHPPADANQQYLGAGISPLTQTQSLSLDPIETGIDAQFEPRLTTQVPENFVPHGETFADTVSVDVAANSTPWATRRSESGGLQFAPVIAEGTLYGPFTHPPSESDSVPRHAPVAAETTLRIDSGPGTYSVDSGVQADEAGYYSWVWKIRESVQEEQIRAASLLPAGYAFTDRFGTPSEGQTVPSRIRWSTELVEHELTLDRMQLIDRVHPTLHDGAWLRDAQGERIPAHLRLTVYQTDEQPKQQPEVPSHATEVATSQIVLTAPGLSVQTEPIPIPWETRGWVNVRACLIAEDQPEAVRGHIEEWCDDFGVADETAQIVLPQVRTQAQERAMLGETIRDTAYVTGPVPTDSDIGFTFYLQPRAGEPKFDESWRRVRDAEGKIVRWTARELGELSADERCLAQPVAQTARVDVTGPGTVESPEVLTHSRGTGYWVEDLGTAHPETGESVELHRGACGIANERTVVEVPEPVPAPKTPMGEPRTPVLVNTGGPISGVKGLCALLGVAGIMLSVIGVYRTQRSHKQKEITR